MFWYIIKKYPKSLNMSIPSIVFVYNSIKIGKRMLIAFYEYDKIIAK